MSHPVCLYQMPNCFDTYVMRPPFPAAFLEEGRLDMMLGGEWGAENAFVAEVPHQG